MSYLEIENYTKVIRQETILNHLTLSLEKGKIYGLYGRNGSGKTMLLRAIAGLIMPTEGFVKINDQIITKDVDFAPHTGILIEHMNMLPYLSAKENLEGIAKIQKIASEEDMIEALNAVGLDPQSKKRVFRYSLGMKQKLCLAQSFFEHQELLLLDEPTNALDDESVQRIMKLFESFKEEGRTLIIASHDRDFLESICDEILPIKKGTIEKRH